MTDIVIIKLYRPDIKCGDYQELAHDDFDLKLRELKAFAKSVGKNIVFTVCNASACADFDCFAEVTYNGELSELEKEKYISIVKYFSQDADIVQSELRVHALPCTIIFTKAQVEASSLVQ